MSQKKIITAALPYANGPVHIGHLAGVYIPADVYARFQRRQGREVAFICGSDEHGIPSSIMMSRPRSFWRTATLPEPAQAAEMIMRMVTSARSAVLPCRPQNSLILNQPSAEMYPF